MTNPIWMIKTRLQLQTVQSGSNVVPYRGAIDALRRIVREEGFATLWKGLGPALGLVWYLCLHLTEYLSAL